ncbi:hypothetical protein Scep_000559 [Stephania cephalantha]|uniref:Uncharacterized protein n=1 Tax=Stephania cephalantha TaxID=152367 RepID=A0AAP0Q349_9MAGN
MYKFSFWLESNGWDFNLGARVEKAEHKHETIAFKRFKRGAPEFRLLQEQVWSSPVCTLLSFLFARLVFNFDVF